MMVPGLILAWRNIFFFFSVFSRASTWDGWMGGWKYTPGTGCVCCPCLPEVWLVSVGSYWGVEIGVGWFYFWKAGAV